MDIRLIARVSEQDAKYLKVIAKELDMNMSEYVRLKTLGENLKDVYLHLIKKRIYELDYNEKFTLKKLLILQDDGDFINEMKVSHFNYLSRGDKNVLIDLLVEEIDEEEIDVEYERKENGKYKFFKV